MTNHKVPYIYDSWSSNKCVELEVCLYENCSCHRLFDQSHACHQLLRIDASVIMFQVVGSEKYEVGLAFIGITSILNCVQIGHFSSKIERWDHSPCGDLIRLLVCSKRGKYVDGSYNRNLLQYNAECKYFIKFSVMY
jgi:hypothetical protein